MTAPGNLVRRARPWLGTIVEIGVPAERESAINAGFAEIARIHRLMSFHEATSDIAKLRRAKAGELVDVDLATVAVLRTSADLHKKTDGLFNVVVGRQLVRTRFLPRIDVDHLSQFSEDAGDIQIISDHQVCLRRRVLIDLGGIAKGYAVDCAVAALQAAGVRCGIVNAGGDLRVFGDSPMPIHVRTAQGGLGDAFAIQNCAVASSENMRTRRTLKGEITTPHICRDNWSTVIDKTVTVVANTCIIADAMTKVAMVEPDLADYLLADHGGHVIRVPVSKAA